jgi:hypothetical protein
VGAGHRRDRERLTARDRCLMQLSGKRVDSRPVSSQSDGGANETLL